MSSISQMLVRRMGSSRTEMTDIAHNLANAETPGFKRMLSTYQHENGADGNEDANGAQTNDFIPSQMRRLDVRGGELESTGRQLDLALEEPDGFFGVRTPSGMRYTRHGRFRLNSDGTIVGPHGHPLATQQGDLRVPPDGQNITVRPTGEVLVDGDRIGEIAVYTFSDSGGLQPEGGTLYSADGMEAERTQANTVLQGTIEKSNVQPMHELVKLMTTSRAYENSMRITKRLGDIKSTLIDRIA